MKLKILILTILFSMTSQASNLPAIELSCTGQGEQNTENTIEFYILSIPESDEKQIVITNIQHPSIQVSNFVFIADLIDGNFFEFSVTRSSFEHMNEDVGRRFKMTTVPTKKPFAIGRVSFEPANKFTTMPFFQIECN